MAQMYPNFIQSEAPPGEKTIFSFLRNHPRTKDWVVFHSYNLPRHVTQNMGEIDFLLLVPGKGVLVLEVKSHKSVARENGKWLLGNDTPTSRSPFDQAQNAMFSFKEEIGDELARGLPFVSAVAFTSVRFSIEAMEWHPWQVIDSNSMSPDLFIDAIENVLESNLSQLLADKSNPKKQHSVGWFNPAAQQPTPSRISEIVRKSRGNFEVHIDPRVLNSKLQGEYKKFMEDQFEAIDSMQSVPRTLFEGAAGTGKTLLAIEASRRCSESDEGVLLLCYNRLLGSYLREQVQNDRGFSGTFDSFIYHEPLLQSLSPLNSMQSISTAVSIAREHQLFQNRFDSIIIDEVQDICAKGLDVLLAEIVVQNPSAKVRLFADFQYQDIQIGNNGNRDTLFSNISSLTPYQLTRNCRNRPGIGKVITYTTGLPDPYSAYRLPDTPNNFEFFSSTYPVANTDYEKLFHDLAKTYVPTNIVILSCDTEIPVEQLPSKLQRFVTNDVSRWKPNGSVALSTTVRKFKGMDAQAVILTNIPNNLDASIMYTGISRAIEKIVLVCPQDIATEIASRIVAQ